MLLSFSKLHEKRITESQDGRNFGGTRALIESFTTLQLCYRVTWKMHSFSAKQARVIFSSISLFMKSWVTAIGEINFLQFPSIVCWRRQIPHSSPQNHPFPSPPPHPPLQIQEVSWKGEFLRHKIIWFPSHWYVAKKDESLQIHVKNYVLSVTGLYPKGSYMHGMEWNRKKLIFKWSGNK